MTNEGKFRGATRDPYDARVPRRLLAFAAVLSLSITGCEAGTRKDLVGMWTWNPSAELPASQVDTKGFPTPKLETLQLRADGTFVYSEKIPGYDTDIQVAGATVRVDDEWKEWKGRWSFKNGELELGSATDEDRWRATLDPKRGWVAANNPSEGGRTFKLTELTAAKLALHDLAIGGHDRTFHRTQSLPPRPTLGER